MSGAAPHLVDLSGVTEANVVSRAERDWSAGRDVAFRVAFDGTAAAHEANRGITGAAAHEITVRWIRAIHARYLSVGISAADAYVTAVAGVSRATVAEGAAAFVEACLQVGLAYVLLRPVADAITPDEFLAFWRDVVRRALEVNAEGTLFVEKRLALHLEALQTIDPRRPSTAPKGSEGCASCPYDRYCGAELLHVYTMDDRMEKVRGSAWCATSMGTFDHVFAMLRSPEGATLRQVHARWMQARDRVAARLRG